MIFTQANVFEATTDGATHDSENENGNGGAHSHTTLAGLHLAARRILRKRVEPSSEHAAGGILPAAPREARTLLSCRVAGAWEAPGGPVARMLVAGFPAPASLGRGGTGHAPAGGLACDWHGGCRFAQLSVRVRIFQDREMGSEEAAPGAASCPRTRPRLCPCVDESRSPALSLPRHTDQCFLDSRSGATALRFARLSRARPPAQGIRGGPTRSAERAEHESWYRATPRADATDHLVYSWCPRIGPI